MLDVTRLRVLDAFARAGSVSAAERALGIVGIGAANRGADLFEEGSHGGNCVRRNCNCVRRN